MRNYQLALSLLKIYILSEATLMPEFVKGTYEELLKESPEIAKELEQYCEEKTPVRDLAIYIKHSNDY